MIYIFTYNYLYAIDDVSVRLYIILTLYLIHMNKYNIKWKYTPLHYAAREGKEAAIDMLLKAGADVNALNEVSVLYIILTLDLIHMNKYNIKLKMTPLHWAAENGREAAVDRLLKAGADVNALDGVSVLYIHM